jgi:hypothetical protein
MIIMDTMKKIFLLTVLNALVLIPVFAQEKSVARDDMWFCPVLESNWYSISKVAFGGGAALGYGDGLAIGLKVMYCDDTDDIRTLELNFLLRFYLFSMASKTFRNSGLFLQLNGGPVIFAEEQNTMEVPAQIGSFSAGLSLGWRFLLGRSFFIEPAVRGGYPYIVGAGLSAGVRF